MFWTFFFIVYYFWSKNRLTILWARWVMPDYFLHFSQFFDYFFFMQTIPRAPAYHFFFMLTIFGAPRYHVFVKQISVDHFLQFLPFMYICLTICFFSRNFSNQVRVSTKIQQQKQKRKNTIHWKKQTSNSNYFMELAPLMYKYVRWRVAQNETKNSMASIKPLIWQIAKVKRTTINDQNEWRKKWARVFLLAGQPETTK